MTAEFFLHVRFTSSRRRWSNDISSLLAEKLNKTNILQALQNGSRVRGRLAPLQRSSQSRSPPLGDADGGVLLSGVAPLTARALRVARESTHCCFKLHQRIASGANAIILHAPADAPSPAVVMLIACFSSSLTVVNSGCATAHGAARGSGDAHRCKRPSHNRFSRRDDTQRLGTH